MKNNICMKTNQMTEHIFPDILHCPNFYFETLFTDTAGICAFECMQPPLPIIKITFMGITLAQRICARYICLPLLTAFDFSCVPATVPHIPKHRVLVRVRLNIRFIKYSDRINYKLFVLSRFLCSVLHTLCGFSHYASVRTVPNYTRRYSVHVHTLSGIFRSNHTGWRLPIPAQPVLFLIWSRLYKKTQFGQHC